MENVRVEKKMYQVSDNRHWAPDFVISSGGTPVLVGDVKYKHNVQSADLHQITAYAAALGLLKDSNPSATTDAPCPPRAFLFIHNVQVDTLRVTTWCSHEILGIEIISPTQTDQRENNIIQGFIKSVDQACDLVVKLLKPLLEERNLHTRERS